MSASPNEPEYHYEAYTYISYQKMRDKLKDLALRNQRYMELTTAEKKYGIKHRVSCGDDPACQVDIVTITDTQSTVKNKKQVYFSGTLHGNEVIGPNAVFYFIEYMLKSEKTPGMLHILENLEVIITPMTNAVGYFRDSREEKLSREG